MSLRTKLFIGSFMVGALGFNGATTHVPAAIVRIVFLFLCIQYWPRKEIRVERVALAPILLALAAIVWGLLSAENPGMGIQPALTVTLVCGLFIALTHGEKNITLELLQIASWAALIHAAAAIFLFFHEGQLRASGYFANPNNLAAWLSPAALCWLYFLRQTPRQKWQALAAIICAAAVILSQSRAGILALLLGGSCFILSLERYRKLGIGLLCAGFVSTIYLLYDRITGHGDPLSFSRFSIWENSLAVAMNRPEGVGIGGYSHALRIHGVPLNGEIHYPRFAQQAHNAFLHAWVEVGILGAVAFVAALTTPCVAIWKSANTHQARLPHLGVFLAFSIPAFFSTTFHLPIIAIMATLWCAHIFRLGHEPVPKENAQPWEHVHASIAAMGIVLTGFLISGIISQYHHEQAEQFADANNFARAQDSAIQAAAAAPYRVGTQLLIESIKFRRGESPIAVAQRLIELAEQYPSENRPLERASSLLAHRANRAQRPEQWAHAAVIGEAGILRNPHDCLTRVPVARALFRGQKPARAIHLLEETIEIEPHCAGAHANLAQIHRIQNRPEQATLAAHQALTAHAMSTTRVARERAILSLSPATKKKLESFVSARP